MKEITKALNRIYKWVEINIPDFANGFQPGLSYQEIQSKVSGISLHPPDEFYDLYQWRNGVAVDIPINSGVYSSGDFLPLEQSLNEYENHIAQDLICENPLVLDLITEYKKELLYPFFATRMDIAIMLSRPMKRCLRHQLFPSVAAAHLACDIKA